MTLAETAATLQNTLTGLLPAPVSVAVSPIQETPPPLFPAEAAIAATMSASRYREFSAGRGCARKALAGLGFAAMAIPVGAGRAPAWPTGVIGSIAHTGTFAVAVASTDGQLKSIGVDIEDAEPLGADLLGSVCHAAEIRDLGMATDGMALAKVLFSAKESIYKCLWPIAGTFIEFPQMEVRLDPRWKTFAATSHGPEATLLPASRLRGAYARVGNFILTTAWIWTE